jgi:N-acetylmuramic acid 6-phosphate etherase
LKAGTAQKMVLNLLSTASMVRLGRVYGNWMIYVALTNQKLRRRGERILVEATGASPSAAEHTLRKAAHNLPVALIMLKTKTQTREAERCLAKSGGNITQALRAAKSRQFNTKRRGK